MKFARWRAALLAVALGAAAWHRHAATEMPSLTSPGRGWRTARSYSRGSPQVASFASDAVKESGPLRLRLTGRLVWDENRTVRLFPPFAGRVLQIW